MESMINYVHEKLKKLGAERLMDNAPVKLKGIGAITGLMTNFQEKIKKTGAESMKQVKLKGLGAVSLMKNVQEKLNKTVDQYEVVNYMKKKFGWDLKNVTDDVKLEGLGAVSPTKDVQEKLNNSADQYEVLNYIKTKQSGLSVDTEFIIIVMAVLVLLVFLLGCIHFFCRGKAGKKMEAPGRKSTSCKIKKKE